MDANKIDAFFVANGKMLPADKTVFIREKLQQVDDSRYMTISSVELKDPTTMLLISIFLGGLGVDRFMMGDTGMGILKLLTAGLCGILWLIDVICITKKSEGIQLQRADEISVIHEPQINCVPCFPAPGAILQTF